jgi:hypothetical protein
MAKPSINAGLDQLRNEMARGATPGSPGSSGNVMPGSNMSPGMPSMGGATGGTQGIPARNGQPPAAGGQPFNSGVGGAPTLNSVRTHSLALGGLKHMVAAGHIAPHHAKAMEVKSRAHIAAYNKVKAPAVAAPRKFGALGGAAPMASPGSDNDGY